MSCLRGDPEIELWFAALVVVIAVGIAMLAMHLFG